VIYSYNKNQQDALFHNFILVNNSTCLSSYVDCLLATSLADSQHN